MEIWKSSRFIESTAREIAAQTQSRTQVLKVPYKSQVSLWPVDDGELLITVLKGVGTLKTGMAENEIEAGDQVLLVEGDEFALVPANPDISFVVQMYWSPVSIGIGE
ncbi:MAG: hypothetical protein ABFS18_03455 [Thermodesulfobacteriota bacterium]